MKRAFQLFLVGMAVVTLPLISSHTRNCPAQHALFEGSGPVPPWHDGMHPAPPWHDGMHPAPPWHDGMHPAPPWHGAA
jgi:hypothetical protein